MANAQPAAAAKQSPSIGILDWAWTARRGVLIKKVDRFGTLGKGGIVDGDELLTVDGTAWSQLDSSEKVLAVFARVGVGNNVKMKLVRKGQEMELSMKVLARRTLNLQLEDVDDVLERKIAP